MILKPGDIIVSYKKPKSFIWPPIISTLNCLFHYILFLKGKHLYPNGIGHNKDHVRGTVNQDTTFEFTYPRARYQEFSDWMVAQGYATVVSLDFPVWNELPEEEKARLIKEQTDRWEGTAYDVGQLVDIWIGWHRVFDFSKRRKVCSVGWRIIFETILSNLLSEQNFPVKVNLFPEVEVEKTLPCCFLNSRWFVRKE